MSNKLFAVGLGLAVATVWTASSVEATPVNFAVTVAGDTVTKPDTTPKPDTTKPAPKPAPDTTEAPAPTEEFVGIDTVKVPNPDQPKPDTVTKPDTTPKPDTTKSPTEDEE